MISGEDGEAFHLGLSDKNSVKRVQVVRRKRKNLESMRMVDGQSGNIERCHATENIFFGRLRQLQLAQGGFYRDFP